jgi:hypothetical protein
MPTPETLDDDTPSTTRLLTSGTEMSPRTFTFPENRLLPTVVSFSPFHIDGQLALPTTTPTPPFMITDDSFAIKTPPFTTNRPPLPDVAEMSRPEPDPISRASSLDTDRVTTRLVFTSESLSVLTFDPPETLIPDAETLVQTSPDALLAETCRPSLLTDEYTDADRLPTRTTLLGPSAITSPRP